MLQRQTHKVHGKIIGEGQSVNDMKEAKAVVNKYVKIRGKAQFVTILFSFNLSISPLDNLAYMLWMY